MPARDVYHDAVKNALIKDGWTITHDPPHWRWSGKNMCVDLGAEQLVAAEMTELERAIGQFTFTGRFWRSVSPNTSSASPYLTRC